MMCVWCRYRPCQGTERRHTDPSFGPEYCSRSCAVKHGKFIERVQYTEDQ